MACAAALGVAGCGTSAPVSKPTVNVAITAPTSGATVGVRQVTVTGTVTPAAAQVSVGGQPAAVRAGSFKRTLRLDGSSQVVTVTAQASGYAPAQANTTINYSPNLAAQLLASTHALYTTAAPPGGSGLSSSSSSTAGALAQAFALPKSAPTSRPKSARKSVPGSKSAPTHTGPTQPTPSQPKSSPPAKTTPAPVTPPPSSPAPTPAPAPVSPPSPGPVAPSPAEIAARIKQQWDRNCLPSVKGTKVIPYCTCIYTHLESTGAFTSPATVRALVRQVNHYLRTGDASKLSPAILRALAKCAPRYPVAQRLTGRTTLTPWSGLSHRPVPSSPISPSPAGPAPTPISPTR